MTRPDDGGPARPEPPRPEDRPQPRRPGRRRRLPAAVPTRTRYEVFRRDNSTCRYCGAQAPAAQITVDRVVPRALGGTDTPANLVTACRDCYSGKTLAVPGAALAPDADADAVRWAAAMTNAQARMLADAGARNAGRAQFSAWWDEWRHGSGPRRQPFPRPAGWARTVDQLTAAGLPLLALRECIETAMTSTHVQAPDKFRYMCGVAWRMLSGLRETARECLRADETGLAGAAASAYEQGILDTARQVLGHLTGEEQTGLPGPPAGDGEPLTEAGRASAAAGNALFYTRAILQCLTDAVRETLLGLPGNLGADCVAEAETTAENGSPLSRGPAQMIMALYSFRERSLLGYANSMPPAVRDEWIAYAQNLHGGTPPGPAGLLIRAAECALAVKAGRLHPAMCSGPGQHTERCPARATRRVRLAALSCCTAQPGGWHGHGVCTAHLAQIAGGILSAEDIAPPAFAGT